MLKIQQKRDFEYEFYNQIYKLKKKPKKGKKKLEKTFSRKKYFGQINRHFVALNFYFKINNKAFENYLNKKKKKSLKDE